MQRAPLRQDEDSLMPVSVAEPTGAQEPASRENLGLDPQAAGGDLKLLQIAPGSLQQNNPAKRPGPCQEKGTHGVLPEGDLEALRHGFRETVAEDP